MEVDGMSEISILPFDDPNKVSFAVKDDKTIIGEGRVIASFSMVNITDQPFYSDKASQGYQIMASNMPLNGGVYWLLLIKTVTKLRNRYTQGEVLQNEGEFELFYLTCNKPLILENAKYRALPYIKKSDLLRYPFEEIKKFEISDVIQNTELSFDTVSRTLSREEVKTILARNYAVNGGFNLKFIKRGHAQQIGYTVAGLVQPLISNNITFIESKGLEKPVKQFVIINQGGRDWPVECWGTRLWLIDGKEYYTGDIKY